MQQTIPFAALWNKLSQPVIGKPNQETKAEPVVLTEKDLSYAGGGSGGTNLL